MAVEIGSSVSDVMYPDRVAGGHVVVDKVIAVALWDGAGVMVVAACKLDATLKASQVDAH